jgi:hypothetical protein
VFFWQRAQFVSPSFRTPLAACRLPRNAPKRTKKKPARAYFFLRAGADVHRLPVFSPAAPIGPLLRGCSEDSEASSGPPAFFWGFSLHSSPISNGIGTASQHRAYFFTFITECL